MAHLNYTITTKYLLQVEALLLEALEKEIEGELDIVKALQEELVMGRTQLIYSITEVRQRVGR